MFIAPLVVFTRKNVMKHIIIHIDDVARIKSFAIFVANY